MKRLFYSIAFVVLLLVSLVFITWDITMFDMSTWEPVGRTYFIIGILFAALAADAL